MLQLCLNAVRRVLCLGAHSDDIEIGAGGTLLKLIEANPGLEVYLVVFCAPGGRAGEAYASATEYLGSLKEKGTIRIESLQESYLPHWWSSVKTIFEEIKDNFDPDLVFTHYREDRHQDHRVLSDLAWNTFRNHLILEYEILKYDGDLGQPNLYVPLSEEIYARKLSLLLRYFRSQAESKHWFSADTFSALHRIRGVECACPKAEAFYARKLTLTPQKT